MTECLYFMSHDSLRSLLVHFFFLCYEALLHMTRYLYVKYPIKHSITLKVIQTLVVFMVCEVLVNKCVRVCIYLGSGERTVNLTLN